MTEYCELGRKNMITGTIKEKNDKMIYGSAESLIRYLFLDEKELEKRNLPI